MTRVEIYHKKMKHVNRKGQFVILFFGIILLTGLLLYKHYQQNLSHAESPSDSPGKKVVVQLPNGQEVYTYEKYIVHKNGKTYYKGEQNTIDLTGGTISYKNWK